MSLNNDTIYSVSWASMLAASGKMKSRKGTENDKNRKVVSLISFPITMIKYTDRATQEERVCLAHSSRIQSTMEEKAWALNIGSHIHNQEE